MTIIYISKWITICNHYFWTNINSSIWIFKRLIHWICNIITLEYLYDTINYREISLNIFVDFRKAFDTVNYSILYRKLELYGIHGLPLKLLKSYFFHRSQRDRIWADFRPIQSLPYKDKFLDPSFFHTY